MLTRSKGILIVKDLPSRFKGLRERLLKLADRFAALPEPIREQYADPASSYRFVVFRISSTVSYTRMPILVLAGRMGR